MATIQEVNKQISSINGLSSFLGKREIKELPNILMDNEKIENLIQGRYNKSIGILVATNIRLVFVDKGVFGGVKTEDFIYSQISSIQSSSGVFAGSITISSSGNSALIDHTRKDQVKGFTDMVRKRMIEATTPVPVAVVAPVADDIVSKLERLAKLKDSGVLDDAEFASQKKLLLGG